MLSRNRWISNIIARLKKKSLKVVSLWPRLPQDVSHLVDRLNRSTKSRQRVRPRSFSNKGKRFNPIGLPPDMLAAQMLTDKSKNPFWITPIQRLWTPDPAFRHKRKPYKMWERLKKGVLFIYRYFVHYPEPKSFFNPNRRVNSFSRSDRVAMRAAISRERSQLSFFSKAILNNKALFRNKWVLFQRSLFDDWLPNLVRSQQSLQKRLSTRAVSQQSHINFFRFTPSSSFEAPAKVTGLRFHKNIDLRFFLRTKSLIFLKPRKFSILIFLVSKFLYYSFLVSVSLTFFVLLFFLLQLFISLDGFDVLILGNWTTQYLFWYIASDTALSYYFVFSNFFCQPVWNIVDFTIFDSFSFYLDLEPLLDLHELRYNNPLRGLGFFEAYWLVSLGAVVYVLCFLKAVSFFLRNVALLRFDPWTLVLRLFYGVDFLRSAPNVDEAENAFEGKVNSAFHSSVEVFSPSNSDKLAKLTYEYNLSAGFGGYIGFIDYFPSYDSTFSKHAFSKDRMTPFKHFDYIKRIFKKRRWWRRGYRKFRRGMRHNKLFWYGFDYRFNYLSFGFDSKNQRNLPISEQIYTRPRFKLPFFKTHFLLWLLEGFSAISHFGDLEITRARERFFYYLRRVNDEFLLVSDEVAQHYAKKIPVKNTEDLTSLDGTGSFVDWYHRELSVVILAKTLESKITLKTNRTFRFGWQNLINPFSFWYPINKSEPKSLSLFSYPTISTLWEKEHDYSKTVDAAGAPLKSFYDETGNDELFFKDEILEESGPDIEEEDEDDFEALNEDFYFEDGYLHLDMLEGAIFTWDPSEEEEEDWREDNIELELYNSDLPLLLAGGLKINYEEQTYDEDTEQLLDFLNSPNLVYGAGQETDYLARDRQPQFTTSDLDFDDSASYSEIQGFSSFYEDVSDFLWLSTTSGNYKNFLEYPSGRFFNPILIDYQDTDAAGLRIFTSQFRLGELVTFFAPFLSFALFPPFNAHEDKFYYLTVISAVLSFTCLVSIAYSGWVIDTNFIFLPPTVTLFFAYLLFLFAPFSFGIIYYSTSMTQLFYLFFTWAARLVPPFFSVLFNMFPGSHTHSSQTDLVEVGTSSKVVCFGSFFESSHFMLDKVDFLLTDRFFMLLVSHNNNYSNLIYNWQLSSVDLFNSSVVTNTFKVNSIFDFPVSAQENFSALNPTSLYHGSSIIFIQSFECFDFKAWCFFSKINSAVFANSDSRGYYFFNEVGLIFQDQLRKETKSVLISANSSKSWVHNFSDRVTVNEQKLLTDSNSLTSTTALDTNSFSRAALFYSVLDKKTFNLTIFDKDISKANLDASFSLDDLTGSGISSTAIKDSSLKPKRTPYNLPLKKLWAKNFKFFSTQLFGEYSSTSSRAYINFLRSVMSDSHLSSTTHTRTSRPDISQGVLSDNAFWVNGFSNKTTLDFLQKKTFFSRKSN